MEGLVQRGVDEGVVVWVVVELVLVIDPIPFVVWLQLLILLLGDLALFLFDCFGTFVEWNLSIG